MDLDDLLRPDLLRDRAEEALRVSVIARPPPVGADRGVRRRD